jgi:hypothetical protein
MLLAEQFFLVAEHLNICLNQIEILMIFKIKKKIHQLFGINF